MTEKTIVLPPHPAGNGADANYRLTVMVPKRRYLSYLRNRWWVVMICVVLTVGGVVAYETLRQETYSSYAQLYLTLGPQLGVSIFTEPKDDFATQIELLKGSQMRRLAFDKVGAETLRQLKGKLEVEVVRPLGTSILQLKVTSSDANVSQRFLQALIDEYLAFKTDTRLSTTEDVLTSLNDEIARRDSDLKDSQKKWAEFQKTNNVSLVQEEARTESLYLADLKMQLQRDKLDRLLLEQGVAPVSLPAATNAGAAAAGTNQVANGTDRTNGTHAAPANLAAGGTNAAAGATNLMTDVTNALASPTLESDTRLKDARIELAELRAERDQLLKDPAGRNNARRLGDEVQLQESRLAGLESAEAEQREASARDLGKRIATTEDSIPAIEAIVKNANDQLSQAQLIKDDIQRQQVYYDNLLGMRRNVDLNKNMAQERVTVYEQPSAGTPAERSFPLRVALAAAGGVCLALGLVFGWHLMDDRLVSIHDLKDQFGETVLGLVPQVRVPKSKPLAALLGPGDTRAGYVESYRHLRSALLLSSMGESRPQTLLFTGAIPAEGKTTIAVNLARLLAQSGQRVALVDADIRGGRIHEMLGKAESPGFLDFLRGQAEAKSIIYPMELPGLSFVPVGAAGGELDGLLNHANLGELMRELKEGRDFVILDSAPILAADDASLLVPHADAVVMVMRPFFTRAGQARRALEMLYQRQARQVTLILNRARTDDLAGEYYARKQKLPASRNGKH